MTQTLSPSPVSPRGTVKGTMKCAPGVSFPALKTRLIIYSPISHSCSFLPTRLYCFVRVRGACVCSCDSVTSCISVSVFFFFFLPLVVVLFRRASLCVWPLVQMFFFPESHNVGAAFGACRVSVTPKLEESSEKPAVALF